MFQTTNQMCFCQMRSKGSRFTLGVWGLSVCSQPSARGLYGRAGKSCNRVTFGGITCCVASFCVAGVVLCDIETYFVTCGKSVWQAQYSCGILKDELQLFVAGAAL